MNFLLIEALQRFDYFYRGAFKVEFPTGSGREVTLSEVAAELSRRLTRIFLRDPAGRRPVHGDVRRFQSDPHWRDLLLFYEYFHGDNGGRRSAPATRRAGRGSWRSFSSRAGSSARCEGPGGLPAVAVGAVFFLNGLVLASWVPYIPMVKAAHGLRDGALGGVLLAMAGAR